jgi:hypothetical protein
MKRASLKWLLPHCERFPRAQRFGVTQRIQDAVLDLSEALYEANAHMGARRVARLEQADAELNKLRLYLRLIHSWDWLDSGQYQHVSRMVAEVGKLLGGWRRTPTVTTCRTGCPQTRTAAMRLSDEVVTKTRQLIATNTSKREGLHWKIMPL